MDVGDDLLECDVVGLASNVDAHAELVRVTTHYKEIRDVKVDHVVSHNNVWLNEFNSKGTSGTALGRWNFEGRKKKPPI